jgi:hypothetical protein
MAQGTSLAPAVGPALDSAATPMAAPAATGLSLRSEFGAFGLSDADDSLLYPNCTVFQLCEEPPDPGIAASATSFMESVNELILIVDRATSSSRVIPNFDFFALDNRQVSQSDPRVLYDAARGRWLATEISSDCGHGYLHMAVSSSDDPFGVWTVYRIVFPGRIVDFPGVGTSSDTVVVSLNAYGADPQSADCLAPGDFEGAMLVVADWSDLEKNVASLPVTTTPPDKTLFTWRPALSAGDITTPLVVAIDNGSDTTSDVGYATLSGTNASRDVTLSPVANLSKEQGVAPFETPPAPRQPGSPPTIERAVDGTPTDAIAASGRLWFIATAPCTPAGDDTVRDCVRVTELATGATPTAVSVASDILLREQGADLYMGGIGRSLDGTLYVTYSRSSPNDRVAAWATWRSAAETTFHDAALLIPAGGVYSGSRWGDYVILAADPATPDAVWQANEVATQDGSWFTWLSRMRPAPLGPLAGSFQINGGDRFADQVFVDLQLTNPPDVALTLVRIANSPTMRDGLLATGLTLPVAADLPWSLAIDMPKKGPADGTRHVYVQWGDGIGHWSDVASDSIILDTTGPTVGALVTPRIGTSSLGKGGKVPVEVQWRPSVDALSGIEGYDVEIKQDGGDWQDFGTTKVALVRGRVQVGHRYRWRIRAFDRLSNVSVWRESSTVRIDALDDRSATIQYAAWRPVTDSAAFKGGVHTATSGGASATFSFTGHGFALVGRVGPGRGSIDVTVDGRHVGRFSEAETASGELRIGFIRTLSSGRHTVRLTAADARQVDLDAVILVR